MLYQQFLYGSEMQPAAQDTGDPDATTWRRFTFQWQDMISADSADDQYFTMDIVNYTSGIIDSTWTDADYDVVVGRLYTSLADLASHIPNRYTCTNIRSFIMAFNSIGNAKPFVHSGAPEKIYPVNYPGTDTATVPAQPCTTITEMTPSRANWGRLYTPTLGPFAYDNAGRLKSATVDSLVANFGDLYHDLAQSQFPVVVPATSANKHPVRTLQGVTAIRVDNVPDVQRSRRLKHSTYKSTFPVATQLEELAAA